MGRDRLFGRISWRAIVPALVLSALVTLWCWLEVGAGLALVLSGALLAALYVPALVSVESGWNRVAATGGAIGGVAMVWAIATGAMDVTFLEWLRCTVVLGAFVLALSGCVSLLSLTKVRWPLASSLTTLLALLWLTWPVWLSHALTQQLVEWLVPAHPLLALNGVISHLGAWDRMPIAYRSLTVLNQDIPYHLPRSIVPSALLHVVIGLPVLMLGIRRAEREAVRRKRSGQQPSSEECPRASTD
jgi:hypothetical protein